MQVAQRGLLHLLTDIFERAGAFRNTERPVDVPLMAVPGPLLTRATTHRCGIAKVRVIHLEQKRHIM